MGSSARKMFLFEHVTSKRVPTAPKQGCSAEIDKWTRQMVGVSLCFHSHSLSESSFLPPRGWSHVSFFSVLRALAWDGQGFSDLSDPRACVV